jgi:hypothetical protein
MYETLRGKLKEETSFSFGQVPVSSRRRKTPKKALVFGSGI